MKRHDHPTLLVVLAIVALIVLAGSLAYRAELTTQAIIAERDANVVAQSAPISTGLLTANK